MLRSALFATTAIAMTIGAAGARANNVFMGLGDLPGNDFASSGRGISADGSTVVGFSHSASGSEAFRWTSGGGMVGLGDLLGGSFNSDARSVSADGSVVVGNSRSASGTEAFHWTSGTGMVGLGDLAGGPFDSRANAVSADGSVAVGYGGSASGYEGFIWTQAGGMVGLGDLPGGQYVSTANAVSADGSLIVGAGTTASGREAFLWDETLGMRRLEDVLVNDYGLSIVSGWLLQEATGISEDGKTIVGWGTNPFGNSEAWLARMEAPLVAAPVPAALPIIAAALGGFGFAGWRQQRKPA